MRRLSNACVQLLALAIGSIMLFPIAYAVFGAFKAPAEFGKYPPTLFPNSFLNFDNYINVFTQVPMARYLVNSLATSFLTGAVKLILACLSAYAFTYFDFAGKKALFMILVGTMMLPADTLTITNYKTISRLGLTDTYIGICVVSFVGASQMFMLIRAFKQLPTAIRDAALIDGCSDLRFLLAAVLPMSGGLMFTLFLQSFIAQWNSYLWPLLVTNKASMRTVQVGITMLGGSELDEYEKILAGAVVALIPSIILFVISRRKISGSVTAGAVTE